MTHHVTDILVPSKAETMAKNIFSFEFVFNALIFLVLPLGIIGTGANSIHFHKNSNQRYPRNILATYTGASLTTRSCSVKCLHTTGCNAYNFLFTSSADKVCEIVKITGCLGYVSDTVNGWTLYSSGETDAAILPHAIFFTFWLSYLFMWQNTRANDIFSKFK